MTTPRSLAWAGAACVILFHAWPLYAQDDGRDPTVAPPQTNVTGPVAGGVEGMTVMVRDGKPYLVVGTRWYATGDKVGVMRVDRISETEVWLHDGVKLIKVPRFAGIERTAVKVKPVCGPKPPPVGMAPVPAAAPSAIGGARNDRPAFDAASERSGKKKVKTRNNAKTNAVDPVPNPIPAVAPCEDSPS